MTDEERQATFLAMLRQSEGILLTLCIHLGRRRENVNDLYQDVVCDLWEHWHTFRGQSSPRTWAIRVALNTIGQKMRWERRQVRVVQLDQQKLEKIAEERDDPEIETLYRLIDRLGNTERQLLLLYLEDLSMAEIAYATGLSENAAKQKIYRIKKKLKRLKEEDENE
ncbi:MAG: sigma-70 family RNA polymerase sigma factor [Bacteroidales bacterium]|nr:sigma-70 family RNA polymerase sigma factor [Bacteroidales bacterium]